MSTFNRSIVHRVKADFSLVGTVQLVTGAFAGGALVRLVTPSALVFTVFVGLLACVLFCLFVASLGQPGGVTWRHILSFPLVILGLWGVPRSANPASGRANLLIVAVAVLVGFTVVQLILR